MYKNNNFDGLSKKDIKRIQEIVADIHAKSMREDLKNAKYVEGYMFGRKSVAIEIADITDELYQFAIDIEDEAPDIAHMIEEYADRFNELQMRLDMGE